MTMTFPIRSRQASQKIALCTTCKGRLGDLKQTLIANLGAVGDDPDIEFCVLAYGDKEAADWVKQNFREHIESGKIRLGFVQAEYFHAPHAKNLAHRLSSENVDVVCNVDADNFVLPEYIALLRNSFSIPTRLFVQKEHKWRPAEESGEFMSQNGRERLGHMGRLALPRKDFMQYGYDESIVGWGGDDTALSFALLRDGYKHIVVNPEFLGTGIPCTDEERLIHINPMHHDISRDRLAGGEFPKASPNLNRDGFGMGDVWINFDETPTWFGKLEVQRGMSAG